MNIGFRVLERESIASFSTVEKFKSIPTPIISDNLNRLYGTESSIKAMHPSKKMIGTALTVNTRAGDNLMVHKAIDIAEPGDIIVVNADGEMTQAILGEIMLRIAEKNQIAGFLIDGAVRDSNAFYKRDFPCFAKGVTHRGPYKEGPGEINVPVTIGKMIVYPGDIVVGDEDGVVAVSSEEAERILIKSEEQLQKEYQIFDQIENGTLDRSWVDQTLHEKGCDVYE